MASNLRKIAAAHEVLHHNRASDNDALAYAGDGFPATTPLLAEEAPGMAHGRGNESWDNPHANVEQGATRAAVLGCLDGLVSNLCLILGVVAPCLTGKESDSRVLLTGIAGIVAGAFSMAVGEWLSITAENESMAQQIEVERSHISEHRKEENEELVSYLVDQGVRAATARQVVADLESRPDATARMLSFHTRFHWGIEEDDLGASPWTAAIVSFLAFACGGFIPLVPWILPCSKVSASLSLESCLWTKLGATLALSVVAMFAVGFALARDTPTNSWYAGLRHVVCGIAAAGETTPPPPPFLPSPPLPPPPFSSLTSLSLSLSLSLWSAMTFGIGYCIGAALD